MSQPTDLRPTVAVGTLHELNEQYLAGYRSLAVGGRYERRDGQLFGLGGLRWQLVTATAVYETVTGEDEVLPNLPVVRAAWSVTGYSVANTGVEVAA